MQQQTVHASAVAIDGRGVLLIGASGRGKSSLALELIALGAALVADDQVVLTRRQDAIVLTAPAPTRGLIEARGIGLLTSAVAEDPVTLALCADLDTPEVDRLPPQRTRTYLGRAIPLVHRSEMCHFAAAITVYLKGDGRVS